MTDEPVSSSDPRQLKKQEIRGKDREKQAIADLQAVVAMPEGRRFLRGLLADAHLYKTSVITFNAVQIAFLEGERNQGVKLMGRLIRDCPERLTEVMSADQP